MPKDLELELWDIKQVAEYFCVSESTIRRRLRDRKNGIGSFIVPVFGFSRIARWRREDIENWNEQEPEIVMVETLTQRNRKVELAQDGLATLGIKVPKRK
jgi:predicted DNA-binding transcriptional regulator AlpA